MERQLAHPVHVIALVAVAGVLAFVTLVVAPGGGSGEVAVVPSAQELHLRPGPLAGSTVPAARPPELAEGGPNSLALWVRDARLLPTAPIGLLQAAGIPARVVTDAAEAFQHPMILVWPHARLTRDELVQLAAYGARDGTMLAVEPDVRTRQVLAYARGGVFARIAGVPEAGLPGAARMRDRQVAALRAYWGATPGGFRLGDAPQGRERAVVLLHDLRTRAAIDEAGAFARAERAAGVRATYVIQPKYLDDAAGPAMLDATARRVVRALHAAGAEVAAGGISGGDIATLEAGDGREAYPSYAPSFGSPTTLAGATLFGELRVSRHLVASLGAGTPQSFRGVGERTAAGFAGVAQGVGFRTDATLAVDQAGGAFPFLQPDAGGGVRPLLRFPVSFQDLPGQPLTARLDAIASQLRRNRATGAPTLVEITPAGDDRLPAQMALIERLAPQAWTGTLAGLAGFWRDRLLVSMDARPAEGGTWDVRLRAPAGVTLRGQSLVSPFKVVRASAGGAPLARVGRRIALPPLSGELVVHVVPRAAA